MASKFLSMIFPLSHNTFRTLIPHIYLIIFFSLLIVFMQVKKQAKSSTINLEVYTIAIPSPTS